MDCHRGGACTVGWLTAGGREGRTFYEGDDFVRLWGEDWRRIGRRMGGGVGMENDTAVRGVKRGKEG